jgi:hypothetical protein
LLGIKPFTFLSPNSLTVSHFGGFWSRVNELTRDLIFNLKRFDSLNHLIIVSNHQVIDFLEKELQKKVNNYQIMFFKDIDFDLKPNKFCDFVHIFDTQYFDYSSSSLLDYRMDFMVYLSKLGDRSRFYIQESKIRLYFRNDNLRVLYKYKEVDTIDFNSKYLFKYEISPQSVLILEDGCKNNMGISAILFLIFQIDELREEVVDPKYRNHKDIELGLKYIETCNLIKNIQDNTNEDVVFLVSNVLNLFIDICSKKKYLKTMINTIFILQKINKLQDKCFKVVIDEKNVLLDVNFTEGYPFTFYVIFEDCSYFLIEIKTPGAYKIGTKERKMYILCNKVRGYEAV